MIVIWTKFIFDFPILYFKKKYIIWVKKFVNFFSMDKNKDNHERVRDEITSSWSIYLFIYIFIFFLYVKKIK